MAATSLALAIVLSAQPAPACGPDVPICLSAEQRAQLGGVAAPAGATTLTEGTPPSSPAGEVDAEGNIVVTAENERPEGDPAEELNAATFAAAQAVDQALVEPIAKAYVDVLPKPIRSGISNFLANLSEPVNALHFLLQLKPGKAGKAVGRFMINSTIGVAGLIDVASKEPFDLEYEANGLANTLGYYGVGPGPYLYLPAIGSTTVRDLVGRVADLSLVPMVAGKPFNDPRYGIPVAALNTLDHRVEVDEQVTAIREQCGDPYAASRDIYLSKRRADINRLRGREDLVPDDLEDRLMTNCDFIVEEGKPDFSRQQDFSAPEESGAANPAATAP